MLQVPVVYHINEHIYNYTCTCIGFWDGVSVAMDGKRDTMSADVRENGVVCTTAMDSLVEPCNEVCVTSILLYMYCALYNRTFLYSCTGSASEEHAL